MIDTASYGKALYQLTAENGSDARVLEELDAVERLLKENPPTRCCLTRRRSARRKSTACSGRHLGALIPCF